MEMTFADAFYFIAILNGDDEYHHEAVKLGATLRTILVTTDYVLVEVADGLAGTRSRAEVEGFMNLLRSASWIDVVPADRELFDAGLALYAARPDKEWSLTDCMSFVVMGSRGIYEALTHDRHFKQAGFKVLL